MIKVSVDKVPVRGPLYATRQIKSAKDMQKLLIAICSSYIDAVPGHVHLCGLTDVAKETVREMDGAPFEFNTIGVDDGIAMGHIGMCYSLPSREIIAGATETVINAHWFDGVFYIPDCDKIMPGMILAILRTNVPAVSCSGRPVKGGVGMTGHQATLSSLFKAVGTYQAGDMSKTELDYLEQDACPTCDSYAGMFIANSINSLMEVLGLTLPGNGTVLVVSDQRRELVRQAVKHSVDNVKNNLRPRDIITEETTDDAFVLNMVMGGSTNMVLHTLAIAHETGIEYNPKDINKTAKRTPYPSKIAPSSVYTMHDIQEIGDISAAINQLIKKGTIKGDHITVTGKTLKEDVASAGIKNKETTHPFESPISPVGGLSALYGNIVQDGAVIKIGGVDPSVKILRGKAICCDSQDEALGLINNGMVKKGHVVVIRYEGPQGSPGMPEMLVPTSKVVGRGLGKDVALITDGRLSEATRSIAIDHASPEAAEGGNIALIENGDEIHIDLTNHTLDLLVDGTILVERRKHLKPFKSKISSGWLRRYTAFTSSTNFGGSMMTQEKSEECKAERESQDKEQG